MGVESEAFLIGTIVAVSVAWILIIAVPIILMVAIIKAVKRWWRRRAIVRGDWRPLRLHGDYSL